MNFMLPRILLCMLLVFPFGVCLAAPVTVGAPGLIQPLTFAEALAAYHKAGEVEVFQCIHVPAGKNNEAVMNAKPIAVEFDEKIYLRIGGKLLGLDRVSSSEKRTKYSDRFTKVEVLVLKRTSTSEYGESDDRLMRLQVFSGGNKISIKTFGASCGV